jgi:peptidoglycan/LPS O-acetylase OafA/YrhL
LPDILHAGLVPNAAALDASGVLVDGLGSAAALLSRPTMTFLRYSSFSLYMVHIPVQMVFWQAWSPTRLAAMHPVLAIACVVLQLAFTVAAASAIYLFVEKPARRYLVGAFGQGSSYKC